MNQKAWKEIRTQWRNDMIRTDTFASPESCFSRFEGEPTSGYIPGLDKLFAKATK